MFPTTTIYTRNIFQIQKGNFAAKRITSNFNMVPPEQVIEQTTNKNQKGAGGIVGSSTNMGCIQRWILSSHIIATWNSDFKQRIGVDRQKT